MARGCVAVRINNRGFAAGKDEFLVRGGVNRLPGRAPAIALPDGHLPLGNDAGELAASWAGVGTARCGAGLRPSGRRSRTEIRIKGLRYEFALLRGGGHTALEASLGLVIPIGERGRVDHPYRRASFRRCCRWTRGWC